MRKQWQNKVNRLTADLAEHPEPPELALWRGRDPLARLDPAAGLGRERSRQRGMNRDDDLGMDLGR